TPSNATMLPRNLQHSYDGSIADASSIDDTGTYNRPSKNAGAPVIREAGCSSTLTFQSGFPVAALTACTTLRVSPKYATGSPLLGSFATLIAVRTVAPASYVQYVQPVWASSE